MKSCIVCNGFEIKSGKNAGKTGVLVGGSGVADSETIVCPACGGGNGLSEDRFAKLVEIGFEPSENPVKLSARSIRQIQSIV